MGVIRSFSLFLECFRIAGFTGLIACIKYLFGLLLLPDIDMKSSVFEVGDSVG